jgi:arylsulfatase A-like enzyme
MSGSASTVRPWSAHLLALSPSVAAVIALETLRVSGTMGGPLLGRLSGTLAEVASAGVRQLAFPVLVAAAQALALWGAVTRPRRLAWRAALVALSAAMIALVWREATEAPYLARDFNVRAVFAVGAVLYTAALLWLSAPQRAPRARAVSGAGVLVASLFMAVGHYQVFVGLYPTLHTAVAMLAWILAHLGLAALVAGTRLGGRGAVALVAAPAMVLLAGAIAPAAAKAHGRPYVAAYSALVRPVATAGTPEELIRPGAPTRRGPVGPLRPDPAALASFERRSGLPRLPAGFSLEGRDVLLVVIDALRYDRTSLAAPANDTSPTLRGLVRRGAFSFSRASSPSNGTFPSMAGMLSMTTPSFTRLEIADRHWHGSLRPEQRTAPEALAEAGYRTFWEGFDFKRVMTKRVRGLDQGFAHHHLEVVFPGRDADADARIAARAIAQIRAARAARQRYFGLVFFASPHDDYLVHDLDRPVREPLDRYDQEVRYADFQLHKVLEEVARDGGLDRTVVVVTSDHGEAFGEHGHHNHLSSLHAEQVHVPLVIWVPGVRGEVLDRPTATLYVLPWLLMTGPPAARDAALAALRDDLGPLLRETEGAVVSEFISRQRQEATLRYEDYTVYYDLMADFFRVFDARRDPGEQQELREARPDLVERFTPRVQAYRRVRFAGQRYFFNDAAGGT